VSPLFHFTSKSFRFSSFAAFGGAPRGLTRPQTQKRTFACTACRVPLSANDETLCKKQVLQTTLFLLGIWFSLSYYSTHF
jgi:hypothetical protein